MRACALCCVVLVAAQTHLRAQGDGPAPLSLIDVPFISQSEALCGGAAAAMVLRYWGERRLSAEAFAHLVDRSAAGIRTDALVEELRRRGWTASGIEGGEAAMRAEISQGRPVLTLIEDRPSTFHYIVMVAWHERGVVFHDPARGPFHVMSIDEFMRRWRAARRWMAIVAPGELHRNADVGSAFRRTEGRLKAAPTSGASGSGACEQAVADGVRGAQAGDFEAAERVLAAAVACPGATRELAGVRALQKRWVEAADLASAAVAADAHDGYAWKVLATSRFVQNDRLGALKAWNSTGEPRLDLVRVDGLTRTRHVQVEHLLDVKAGDLLTVPRFARARRQLAELPSASSTRLEYVPVPSGLAELRAVVAERPVLPAGRLSLTAVGLAAAAAREVRLTIGSLAGDGENISVAWRFWPHRPRVGVGVRAPARWGGIWSIEASAERQPFTEPAVPRAERLSARAGMSDWITGRVRWDVAAGVDEWAGDAPRGSIGGGVRLASLDDRIDGRAGAHVWVGNAGFATLDAGVRARSSTTLRGLVVLGTASLQIATDRTPLDLWWAGDTGHARSILMRAHPVLNEGRLRVDRLGRALAHASVEAQRWWAIAGPVRGAAAAFGDMGRTSRRRDGSAVGDLDVGVGARLAVAGMPGVFRVDVGKGLRDGTTAVSILYGP